MPKLLVAAILVALIMYLLCRGAGPNTALLMGALSALMVLAVHWFARSWGEYQ
jgi:hypothetical protein